MHVSTIYESELIYLFCFQFVIDSLPGWPSGNIKATSGNIKQQSQGVGGHRVYVGIRYPKRVRFVLT